MQIHITSPATKQFVLKRITGILESLNKKIEEKKYFSKKWEHEKSVWESRRKVVEFCFLQNEVFSVDEKESFIVMPESFMIDDYQVK
jgi:hypothetical protein